MQAAADVELPSLSRQSLDGFVIYSFGLIGNVARSDDDDEAADQRLSQRAPPSPPPLIDVS